MIRGELPCELKVLLDGGIRRKSDRLRPFIAWP
jgi:hypothetical protein